MATSWMVPWCAWCVPQTVATQVLPRLTVCALVTQLQMERATPPLMIHVQVCVAVMSPHTMCVELLSYSLLGCPANWRSSSMSPLACMPCPVRSERPFGGQQDNCTCLSGYEYGVGINTDMCVGESNTECLTSHWTLSHSWIHTSAQI